MLIVLIYYTFLIVINKQFRIRLIKKINKKRFARIKKMIKKNNKLKKNAAALSYRLKKGLLYYDDLDNRIRLCILEIMEQKVF